MAHVRQSRPDYGLGVQVNVLRIFQVDPAPYALHSAPYTLLGTLCTLHSTLYTLHPALCTLHSSHCTVHPSELFPAQAHTLVYVREEGVEELVRPVTPEDVPAQLTLR
jgi:hypothetical protein